MLSPSSAAALRVHPATPGVSLRDLSHARVSALGKGRLFYEKRSLNGLAEMLLGSTLPVSCPTRDLMCLMSDDYMPVAGQHATILEAVVMARPSQSRPQGGYRLEDGCLPWTVLLGLGGSQVTLFSPLSRLLPEQGLAPCPNPPLG